MTVDDIQKFLDKKTAGDHDYVKVSFKKNRETIFGLFVREHRDYAELKAKNFWRIVPQSQFTTYRKTGDVSLAKIFCGDSFSRLALSSGSLK